MASKITPKSNKQLKTPVHSEIQGFCLLAFSLILLLSLVSFAMAPEAKNWVGTLGHTLGWTFHTLFGLGSYLLCFYLGWMGWRYLFNKPIHNLFSKSIYFSIALISACILLSFAEHILPTLSTYLNQWLYPGLWLKKKRYHLGGAPFFYFYYDFPDYNLVRLLNSVGVALIFSMSLLASLLFLFKIRAATLGKFILNLFKKAEKKPLEVVPVFAAQELNKEKTPEKESDFLRFVKLRLPEQEGGKSPQATAETLAIQPEKNLKNRPSHKEMPEEPQMEAPQKSKRDAALIAQSIHNGDFAQYILPSLHLLTNAKKIDQSSLKKDLKRKAEILEETLLSFGIEAKVGQINCGPTITSFEVHPAVGVKVQKIKTLENDIALNMEAKSIRIIAPIPGKAVVGVEVPNAQPQEVGFKDMLMAYQQGTQKFHIPILLGKAVNGDYVMSDLAKMPHCIIAGATGSGKSVCINTIVMSIVLNARPDQIKLIMVDPKKVELTPYTRLPHMLSPVITEPQGAAAALNWLVKEMENRYEFLKITGVRNIDSFNKRVINEELEGGKEIPRFLPFIVGIIDELADLMMVASSDIETPIARIAQMARAVGIHLILATQRPSREVITGLIKANFPTRISFKVASRINSQIILDETGAEALLGNGDMLFLPPGSSHLIRAQGAYIRDEDIQAVINFICDQAPPNYVIQSFDRMGEGLAISSENVDLDTLFGQAKEVVLSTGNASTTFLQRKLKIGYARAASLMDQLQMQGVVGPQEGSKPRRVFGPRIEESDTDEYIASLEEDMIE